MYEYYIFKWGIISITDLFTHTHSVFSSHPMQCFRSGSARIRMFSPGPSRIRKKCGSEKLTPCHILLRSRSASAIIVYYLCICLERVVLSLTSAVAVVILGFSSPTYYQRYFIILHYSYIYSNYRYKSYLLYLDFEVSRSNTSVEKFHCGQKILFAESNMIFIISLWAKTCLKDIGIVCKCKCLLF